MRAKIASRPLNSDDIWLGHRNRVMRPGDDVELIRFET
jgi:hypothetical protein